MGQFNASESVREERYIARNWKRTTDDVKTLHRHYIEGKLYRGPARGCRGAIALRLGKGAEAAMGSALPCCNRGGSIESAVPRQSDARPVIRHAIGRTVQRSPARLRVFGYGSMRVGRVGYEPSQPGPHVRDVVGSFAGQRVAHLEGLRP